MCISKDTFESGCVCVCGRCFIFCIKGFTHVNPFVSYPETPSLVCGHRCQKVTDNNAVLWCNLILSLAQVLTHVLICVGQCRALVVWRRAIVLSVAAGNVSARSRPIAWFPVVLLLEKRSPKHLHSPQQQTCCDDNRTKGWRENTVHTVHRDSSKSS